MSVMIWVLLALVAIGLPAAWWWQQQQAKQKRPSKPRVIEARDTVADWPPEATRILTNHERRAYETLRQALPNHIILAQVPLARFIRVPTRYSYGEWLSRVGQLSVDLLVCDPATQVLAVIEVRGANESARSQQRHQRMVRVLKAAGLRVVVWTEGDIPTADAARSAVLPEEAARKAAELERAAAAAAIGAGASRAIPPSTMPKTIPVADVHDGEEPPREPPPTTWYSDLDEPSHPTDDDERPTRR
jgi:hypothetical protein